MLHRSAPHAARIIFEITDVDKLGQSSLLEKNVLKDCPRRNNTLNKVRANSNYVIPGSLKSKCKKASNISKLLGVKKTNMKAIFSTQHRIEYPAHFHPIGKYVSQQKRTVLYEKLILSFLCNYIMDAGFFNSQR